MDHHAASEQRSAEMRMLSQKLAETGERQKLKEHIVSVLTECGWRDELKKHCVQHVQDRGVEKVTIQDITAAISPPGAARRSRTP
ncbi:unnamed protein product [Prorocentrum cordatum]|uniref:Transcription and mRNA export factor ENY2 n=1 Tax=Prorocentrum cordatum TaxID=2364126 RepID=A0ABN9XC40_9DINO|nr:unnamed protein product [Polarella glacialis]